MAADQILGSNKDAGMGPGECQSLDGNIYLCQGGCVLVGVSLVVNRVIQKLTNDFHKIWWKLARGPQKKPLDFGGCPDHIRLLLVSK